MRTVAALLGEEIIKEAGSIRYGLRELAGGSRVGEGIQCFADAHHPVIRRYGVADSLLYEGGSGIRKGEGLQVTRAKVSAVI